MKCVCVKANTLDSRCIFFKCNTYQLRRYNISAQVETLTTWASASLWRTDETIGNYWEMCIMFLYVLVPFAVMGVFALVGLTLDHFITLCMGDYNE